MRNEYLEREQERLKRRFYTAVKEYLQKYIGETTLKDYLVTTEITNFSAIAYNPKTLALILLTNIVYCDTPPIRGVMKADIVFSVFDNLVREVKDEQSE